MRTLFVAWTLLLLTGLVEGVSQTPTRFIIFKTDADENDNPAAIVYVQFANKMTQIAKITGNAELVDKKEFAEKGIPKNAIAACGAWWAGAGDYFYLLKTPKGIAIYKGWQDEGQQDKGYHWTKLKEISQ
ncbi:hypothetical protein FHS57_006126 [Runella defluvii]|uniref:Uncharacterized protein n=1 Tax=Runella defluvii TaxID=370973 RepID=A0A7W5ZV25_9BACT|nr:hypothetical protein [Runella defluvii]MBB3842097.1 hypothetical protein [Runella defluvii]